MGTASGLRCDKSNPALPRLNGPLLLPLMLYPFIANSCPMTNSCLTPRMLAIQPLQTVSSNRPFTSKSQGKLDWASVVSYLRLMCVASVVQLLVLVRENAADL
jgi:hypothetical protein